MTCALSQRGAPVCQARLPAAGGASVEALAWSGGRLFSTGLHGHILEHSGPGLEATASASVTGGAGWCLAAEPAGRRLATGTEDGQVVLHTVTDRGLVFDRRLTKQVGLIQRDVDSLHVCRMNEAAVYLNSCVYVRPLVCTPER